VGEVIGGTRGNVVLGKIIVSVLGFNVIYRNIYISNSVVSLQYTIYNRVCLRITQ